MKTSLIITTYHLDKEMAQLTKACLESLVERPDEVIVVDDCSPYKVKYAGADKYIFRGKNGGFPKCANTGFKEATGDILILSNNDIIYNPGWLEGILKPFDFGFDISSIKVSDADGYVVEDKITEGDRFGSLWAMKRNVYETLGGFDESFDKGTFEDLDFHKRALAAGFRIGKNQGALVEHVGRATMDKIYPDRQDFKEGQQHFIKKYGRLE